MQESRGGCPPYPRDRHQQLQPPVYYERPLLGSPTIDSDDQEYLLEELSTHNIGGDFIDSIYREDMEVKYNPMTNRQTGPPARESFAGKYNFTVNICTTGPDRRTFAYSSELNRVYLPMLAHLPVDFKWSEPPEEPPRDLWVRATVILAGADQQEIRVVRCHNHRVAQDPSNRDVPPNIHAHILRSTRQQTDDVLYCGNEEDGQQWLSVAFRPQRSADPAPVQSVTHVYTFTCKHSCTSGINRRRIDVLFTLEDATGKVHGRKSIGVRVCSCPKRDMEKDLQELQNRRSDGPPQKRRMIVNSSTGPRFVAPPPPDDGIINFNLGLYGRDIWEVLHTVAHGLTVSRMVSLPAGHEGKKKCRTALENLEKLKRKLDGESD